MGDDEYKELGRSLIVDGKDVNYQPAPYFRKKFAAGKQ